MTLQYSAHYKNEFLDSFYVGIILGDVLYGGSSDAPFKRLWVDLVGQEGVRKGANSFYVLFSTVMLFVITVWVVVGAIFGQKMWLADAGFPGGPYAYWEEYGTVWYMDWSRAGMLVLQLMADGLMIHRCRTVWNSNRVVIIPIVLWVATLALGIFVTWSNSIRESVISLGVVTYEAMLLTYWTLSAFLNTTLTCMICYRVVRHAERVREHLGKEHASLYFTVVTVVIESVLPLTLSSIAFLVSLGMGSATFLSFLCVYLLMTCISPQMLILRVISGRAWDRDKFNQRGSTIRFARTTATQMRESIHLQAPPNVPCSSGHGKAEILEA